MYEKYLEQLEEAGKILPVRTFAIVCISLFKKQTIGWIDFDSLPTWMS
ncbi:MULTISPECIES: hypothetical protein [Clostridia]|jgi:mannose/fructose/N-acetylgalactosamine-specific phosphotransferase system component IIC|nr:MULTISPECIES: hypothetical protein [Clostridia]